MDLNTGDINFIEINLNCKPVVEKVMAKAAARAGLRPSDLRETLLAESWRPQRPDQRADAARQPALPAPRQTGRFAEQCGSSAWSDRAERAQSAASTGDPQGSAPLPIRQTNTFHRLPSRSPARSRA